MRLPNAACPAPLSPHVSRKLTQNELFKPALTAPQERLPPVPLANTEGSEAKTWLSALRPSHTGPLPLPCCLAGRGTAPLPRFFEVEQKCSFLLLFAFSGQLLWSYLSPQGRQVLQWEHTAMATDLPPQPHWFLRHFFEAYQLFNTYLCFLTGQKLTYLLVVCCPWKLDITDAYLVTKDTKKIHTQ